MFLERLIRPKYRSWVGGGGSPGAGGTSGGGGVGTSPWSRSEVEALCNLDIGDGRQELGCMGACSEAQSAGLGG